MPLDWAGAFAQNIEQLGDAVTLYTVPAAQASGSGVTLTGVFERRPTLNDEGRVDNLEETVDFDDATVAKYSIDRGMSVKFGGRLYDIVRILPAYPGAIECHLEEYLG
jgi:hypothetical protein